MTAHKSEAPFYISNPIKWLRFYAHTKPNLFFSVAIGLMAPVFLFGVTPLRKKFLFADAPTVPLTYPIPQRPRDKNLTGYED